MKELICKRIEESILLKKRVMEDQQLLTNIELTAMKIIEAYQNGGKVIVVGNGGSAADAQHIVAELVGRFVIERRALPAIALTTNSSNITAIANDYGYDEVFSRQVEALVSDKDILMGISTSGNSQSIVKSFDSAKNKGAFTVGLLGKDGGSCAATADLSIIIRDNVTARIQEVHILIGHIICELIENRLFAANEMESHE